MGLELFSLNNEQSRDHTSSDKKELPNMLNLDDELLSACTGAFITPLNNAFGQAFRVYNEGEGARRQSVEDFYRINHINQTFDFAMAMREKHCKLDKSVMGVWECCELLNEFVDESDPDLDEPQIEHLLQTAEAIRRDYPNEDWFHLTGLIHDLGKVLLHPDFGEEPQWAVVGDTFPLGCALDPAIVHYEFFMENPDFNNPKYNMKNGIYEEGCGLDKVVMSWGHDEYMYQVMKLNNCTLPPQALFIIRYHSFYALHRAGAYTHLLDDFDRAMLPWLKIFNQYDLYSKSKIRIDVEEVMPYYLSLVDKGWIVGGVGRRSYVVILKLPSSLSPKVLQCTQTCIVTSLSLWENT